MSTVISISTRRRCGVARVRRAGGVARAGVYRRRGAADAPPEPRRRPGPQGPMSDAALVEAIRRALADSPFPGEGYRKVWARLRHAGLRTSRERVRRLRRENGLAAAARPGRPRGPGSHDGTIIPETIDAMWGTDRTAARMIAIKCLKIWRRYRAGLRASETPIRPEGRDDADPETGPFHPRRGDDRGDHRERCPRPRSRAAPS